ncbi:hypothetical protein NQZ68_032256 [Dissostichus eleginoides]|nr:hypothetical protein NQZ68_032256 [Dissostichus eleginoides]
MCLVTTLRLAFKQALNSGRVYKQRLNVCDPSPTPAGDVRVDFEQYARLLSDCEWTTFQRDERAYRGTLDTKLLQVRSNFAVTHGGAEKWGRLVTILTSASATQQDSRPYGFQLLKYVARILKKFPLSADFPVDLTPDSLTPWIEMQLRFILERIQPALRAAGTETKVICGQQLTEPIALKVGIKTGCPWSAVNFILALNQWMKWIYQCAPLHVKSPNPVQGYADDVQVSSRQEDVIINMLARTDEFLQWSGLEVKQAKCAVLHERRSGGNR